MNNRPQPVLLVDDDPVNLEILVEHLEEVGYQTVTASQGAEAWELLQQESSQFQAVLLDRMMPVMNGMEVLEKIKAHASLRALPVIMQTAAASPDEIREGIEAGAFYYLTKPFSKQVLLALVKAAVDDFTEYQSLQHDVAQQSKIFQCLDSAEFSFHTLEEAHTLALLLANTCPDPSRAIIGLMDLLVNAIEHGNLQITFDEKTQLLESGNWETEIARRLTLPEFAHKHARITFHRRPDHIQFTIIDQGEGFDWKLHLDINPDMAFASHGRGIAMARALSFDILEYRGVGNEVACTIHLTETTSSPAEDAAMDATLILQQT